MRVSVSIEGVLGLTWPLWKQYVSEVESLGFSTLYMSDHFAFAEPVDLPSLDMVAALTYAADHTDGISFGPLVSPLSYRDPVLLARLALALQELSGGRMILGVGAGWNESEHTRFGYELGDLDARFDRFQEGLEVITGLVRGVKPISFSGRYFTLHEAAIATSSSTAATMPILIGGSGLRRTLPLVARYADIWNAVSLSPASFRERSARLDELVVAAGRAPGDILRSMLFPAFCGRSPVEIERRFASIRRGFPETAGMTFDELRSMLTDPTGFCSFVGPADGLVDHIDAYRDAGADEVIIQWPAVDIDGLRELGRDVLPAVTERLKADA